MVVDPDRWNTVFEEEFPQYRGNPFHHGCDACWVGRMNGRKKLVTDRAVLMSQVRMVVDPETRERLYVEVDGWDVLFSRDHVEGNPFQMPDDWPAARREAIAFLEGRVDNVEVNLTRAGGRMIYGHYHEHLINRHALDELDTDLHHQGLCTVRLQLLWQ